MRNWRSFSSYYAARGFGLGLDGGRKAESPTAAACATNNARVKEMDAISATSLHHGVGKKVNDRSQSNYSSTIQHPTTPASEHEPALTRVAETELDKVMRIKLD
jgi:hypothetical protein